MATQLPNREKRILPYEETFLSINKTKFNVVFNSLNNDYDRKSLRLLSDDVSLKMSKLIILTNGHCERMV